MGADERAEHCGREVGPHETFDDREPPAQGLDQAVDDVVAVDGEAAGRFGRVRRGDVDRRRAVEDGGAERRLGGGFRRQRT